MSNRSRHYLKGVSFVLIIVAVICASFAVPKWQYNTWEKAHRHDRVIIAFDEDMQEINKKANDVLLCMSQNETATAQECGYAELLELIDSEIKKN